MFIFYSQLVNICSFLPLPKLLLMIYFPFDLFSVELGWISCNRQSNFSLSLPFSRNLQTFGARPEKLEASKTTRTCRLRHLHDTTWTCLIPERNYKILLDTREQFYNFDLQKYLTAKRQVAQTLCCTSANFKAIFKPSWFY